jgi:hypothetical protein
MPNIPALRVYTGTQKGYNVEIHPKPNPAPSDSQSSGAGYGTHLNEVFQS